MGHALVAIDGALKPVGALVAVPTDAQEGSPGATTCTTTTALDSRGSTTTTTAPEPVPENEPFPGEPGSRFVIPEAPERKVPPEEAPLTNAPSRDSLIQPPIDLGSLHAVLQPRRESRRAEATASARLLAHQLDRRLPAGPCSPLASKPRSLLAPGSLFELAKDHSAMRTAGEKVLTEFCHHIEYQASGLPTRPYCSRHCSRRITSPKTALGASETSPPAHHWSRSLSNTSPLTWALLSEALPSNPPTLSARNRSC